MYTNLLSFILAPASSSHTPTRVVKKPTASTLQHRRCRACGTLRKTCVRLCELIFISYVVYSFTSYFFSNFFGQQYVLSNPRPTRQELKRLFDALSIEEKQVSAARLPFITSSHPSRQNYITMSTNGKNSRGVKAEK